MLFVLDDFLEIIQRYILQRYTSNSANKVLKVVFYIRTALDDIFKALKKKWFSCLILTGIIWGLETLVFVGFYSVTGNLESLLYLAVLVFLSSLLPSGPIGYGGIQLAFYYVGLYWNFPDFIGYSIWYNVFIFLPAIMLAFLLSLRSVVISKMQIVIDLDNTITVDSKDRDYSNKYVNKNVVEALRQAKRQGYSVHIFTARNMNTYNCNLEKIHKYTKPIAKKWLQNNDVPYDELTFGKPWCKEGGFYVDDKLVSPEEFIFKFLGPFGNKSFDVVVPFFNEQNNVDQAHSQLKKLERILNINRYIYIQNGSNDNTANKLNTLSKNDPKIHIEHIDKNQGYGHGFKKGFKVSNADYILTNHSDCQFDAYVFLISHMQELLNRPTVDAIFPKRLNRRIGSAVRTWILQKILQLLLGGREIKDFNGQPKIFYRKHLPISLPNDFCLDLAIYLEFQKPKFNAISLPIIEKDRHTGTSSWGGSKKRQLAIMIRYIRYTFKRENP